MTLGVMQPYFFPYYGYFQLIQAVDVFVVYDDVQYIKSGYINRNRILMSNGSGLFTLQLNGASSNKNINQIGVGNNQKKLIRTLNQEYHKAPYFEEVMPILIACLNCDEGRLSDFLLYSLSAVVDYLGISTKLVLSSSIEKPENLNRTDKLAFLCKYFGASKYVNSMGGKKLYLKEDFEKKDVELKFLEPNKIIYQQLHHDTFVPNLSIIDVMMFNDKESIREFLNDYKLV